MREVGNSLRWMRVSWRWEGAGVNVVSDWDASGVREMDQASPLRKRTFDDTGTEVLGVVNVAVEVLVS